MLKKGDRVALTELHYMGQWMATPGMRGTVTSVQYGKHPQVRFDVERVPTDDGSYTPERVLRKLHPVEVLVEALTDDNDGLLGGQHSSKQDGDV